NPDLYSASLSWCNVGVGLWFELITGSSDLLGGKLTTDQEAFMKNSADFELLTDKNSIQSLANDGNLVIGVLNKYNDAGEFLSGHIVGVIPGDATCYATWGFSVPMVMDTGIGQMKASINAAWSWQAGDGTQVSWYQYKPH